MSVGEVSAQRSQPQYVVPFIPPRTVLSLPWAAHSLVASGVFHAAQSDTEPPSAIPGHTTLEDVQDRWSSSIA